MASAVGLLVRRKKIMKGLERAGAVSPETAIPFEEIGLIFPQTFSGYTERLVAKGDIKRTHDGRYYV